MGEVIYETSKPRYVVEEEVVELTPHAREIYWSPWRGFDTREEAVEEADRLSRVNPGVNYRVVDTQD